MRDFLAALHELWIFAWGSSSLSVDLNYTPLARPANLDVVPAPTISTPPPSRVATDTRAYVRADIALCFARPVHTLDGVKATFSYGVEVLTGPVEGRFVYISGYGHEGWVLKDSLTPHRTDIYPELQSGRVYEYDDPATVAIRRVLKDPLAAAELIAPLQPAEYIFLYWQLAGVNIDWPDIRPRTPGLWRQLLKGRSGVHVGIEPKTHAIMEWVTDSGEGFLAVVDAVQPDETLVVSHVGVDSPGQFTKQKMLATEWRELRPVFIAVT
jgi:hypothetical protein